MALWRQHPSLREDFTINVLFAQWLRILAVLHPKTKPSEYRIGRRTDGSLIWIGGMMQDPNCGIMPSIYI